MRRKIEPWGKPAAESARRAAEARLTEALVRASGPRRIWAIWLAILALYAAIGAWRLITGAWPRP